MVGYFTLYNDHVHIFSSQRSKHSWNLPSEIDLFPAVKIHYLGIDRRFRNQGYGRFLLTEAVYIIEQIANSSGCNFITVEALKCSIDFYEKYGFVLRQRDREFQHMALKLDELLND